MKGENRKSFKKIGFQLYGHRSHVRDESIIKLAFKKGFKEKFEREVRNIFNIEK